MSRLSRINTYISFGLAILSGMTTLTLSTAAFAEDNLRSLTVFPSSDATAQLYERFVKLVNERGKGKIKISVIGGPEIVPGFQQTEAVARGSIDMTYAPISYSLGSMPEADAWVGSNLPPSVQRENGGFALFQEIAAKRLKIHVLARFAPAAPLNVFLINTPKFKADGEIDLSGLRLRASPLYNAFFEKMGATPVTIPVPDVYTGLERGTFDGMAYPPSAMEGWSWDRFLKYRIEPGFMQSDLGIYVNPTKWAALSADSKKILTDTAVEFEGTSYKEWQDVTTTMNAKFDKQGMKAIVLEGAARDAYLKTAYDSVWNRLKASGSPDYEKLRAHYFAD